MDTKNIIASLSAALLDEVKKVMKKEKGETAAHEKAEKDDCNEELKGGQKKIDANHNGKLDAEDFKKLRKKKGVAETYAAIQSGEDISEEEVDEAVKNPYAVGMAAAEKATGDKPPLKKSTIVKGHEIAKKIKEETEEVSEEAEDIQELSKSTLGSYIKKATPSAIQKGIEHGVKKAERDEMDRNMNRHMSFADKDKVHDIMKTTHKDVDKPREKALRRNQGIIRATNRLTKEDVELTQEEIEKIEATLADLDEARGRPPKEGSDAWKKRQEEGQATADEPRQHPIQQLERIKRDMRGGGDFLHRDGSTHHVTGTQASTVLAKYHGLKPAEKESMQKEIHASHAGMKKHF